MPFNLCDVHTLAEKKARATLKTAAAGSVFFKVPTVELPMYVLELPSIEPKMVYFTSQQLVQ